MSTEELETSVSAFQEEIDKQEADKDVLRENKALDIVEVANANVIANEHQAYLGYTALTTGYLYKHSRNVNTILTGPSAGGKSDTQSAIKEGLPLGPAYEATDASNMGVLDDDRWENALYAPLDEWQKIPETLTEIIKSVSGGPDDEYRYVRSVSDEDSDSGRSGHEIVKAAKPYQFLYAQHALDHELSTRLLFLPIDDNVHIREAIVKKQAGHENIDVQGYDKEFIYDASATERALRQHIRELPTALEDGEPPNRRGGVDACLPPWVHYSVKPIFDMNETETNRVAGQVYNLIRAATVHNYDRRDSVVREMDGHEIETYITKPQDVANVLSTRETLLATTHQLSTVKRAILDSIRAHSGVGESDGRGVTVNTIRDYLEHSSSLSTPGKDKLRDLLRELADKFYVTIHERAGPQGAHLYEFNSLRDIGVPRVGSLAQYMSDEEIEESRELDPEIDLDDPFDGCLDPFEGRPFKETVEELRNEFSDDPVERASRTAELVSSASGESEGDGDDDGTLTVGEAMGGGDSGAQRSLGESGGSDSDGPTIEDPLKKAVHARLQTYADGETFDSSAQEAHLLGIADDDESLVETDVNGTLYDPEHSVWEQPDKPDDWVQSQDAAERQVEEAVTDLERDGVVRYEVASDGEEVTVVVE